jgi:DNA-binding MarR family transcriptional regulator
MLQSKPPGRREAPVRASKMPTRGGLLHDVDYQALAQFRYRLRKFLSFSEAAAQKAGLTPQQHQALLAIKGFSRSKPISVGGLADFLLIRHHTAVELVDRMAKLGLLRRIADDDDGRRMLLSMTRKGEQKLLMISKLNFEELQTATPAFTGLLRSLRRSRKR